MKLYRLLIKVFIVISLLGLAGVVRAQDDRDPGQDIAVISLEADNQNNNAYITHSGNVTESWKERLGNNQTITYLAGNFNGTADDNKDDIACLDFDENDDPYAFTESSFGVTPITAAWDQVLRSGDKKFYYFLSGDFDGDGNADIATFYRDFAGDHPESDVRAKITYGPTGVRQTTDEEDWQLPEELSAGFITGKFAGSEGQNDTVKDIAAIREVGANYEVRIYAGPDGTLSQETWTIGKLAGNPNPVAFGGGDFNGDGWDDVAIVFYHIDDHSYTAAIRTNPNGFQFFTSYSKNLENTVFDSILFNDYDKDGYTDIAGVIDDHSGSRLAKIFYSVPMGQPPRSDTWTLNGTAPVTQYLTGDFGRFKGTISGTVFQEGGVVGLGGATVTMKIASSNEIYLETTTDEDGNYEFTNIVNNEYVVTAYKESHGFVPVSNNVTVFNASVSDVNFISTNCPYVYRISGHVMAYKEGGVPDVGLQGMTVTGTGTSSCDNSPYNVRTTTDSSGYYYLSVPTGSFEVVPGNPHDINFTFIPDSRSVEINIASVSGVDFVGGDDECPYDEAKTEAGACGCGVPDLDGNHDGTPDCIDLCPDDASKMVPGVCGCNVPDVDIDNDGFYDCADICPNDPGKTAPGICGCGIADIDFDNDGKMNCEDSCLYDPYKAAPGICGCGISDADNNSDSVPDCEDACPDDPNKTSAGMCGCGELEIDKNKDGICDSNGKYTIAGRVVGCSNASSSGSNSNAANSICQGTGTIQGVSKIIVQSAVGTARTRTLEEYKKCYPNDRNPESKIGSYQIPDPCEYLNGDRGEGDSKVKDWLPVSKLFDGSHEAERLNYELHKIRGAYTFWVRALEAGKGIRVVRYFNLQANNKLSNNKFVGCPDRDTFQYNSDGTEKTFYESRIPLLIDDTQRTALGGEFCRFDPVSLYRDMVEMDFLVVGCIANWAYDSNGECVKKDSRNAKLLPPTNIQATKNSTDKITISWNASDGASDYHVYRSQLTSFQNLIQKIGKKGLATNDISTFSSRQFKSDEYIGSRYKIFDQENISFVDQTAIPGVRYVYSIKASNMYQRSDLSDLAEGYRTTGINDYYDPDAPLSDCSVSSDNDSDGDGVSNANEILERTNPCDRGSFLTKLSSPVYTKYNTYLGQANYLELTVVGTKSLPVTIRIYSASGVELVRKWITIPVNSEIDVDISKWVFDVVKKVDQFGLVRLDFKNDPEARLGGRMSVYRENLGQSHINYADRSFSFAFTRELRNQMRGSSYLIANTIDPTNQGRTIQNWIEINSLEWGKRTFVVNYYDNNGKLIRSRRVATNRLGESDVQGGHEFGPGMYLIEIIPVDGASRYFATLMRYGTYDSPVIDQEEFNFGFQIDAKPGIGDTHIVPISRLKGTCWSQANQLEIANVKNQTVTATVKYYNRSGKLVANAPITLKPHQQIIQNSDALLDLNEIGMAEVSSSALGSLVTQSVSYFHDCEENDLQSAYNVSAMIAGSDIQNGTYNRCLDMTNLLTVMNAKNESVAFDINTQKSGSMRASSATEYRMSKYMTMLFDLSDSRKFSTAPDTYGSLKITSSEKNKVAAMNVRIRQSEGRIDFAMPTAVR